MDDRLRYLPPGYTVPTNTLEALKAARAVIEDDGRWCQGSEFEANGADDEPDPFCKSWQACAVGAVAMVTMGVEKKKSFSQGTYWGARLDEIGDEYRALYDAAVESLDDATYEYILTSEKTDEYGDPFYAYTSVVDKNDDGNTTHAEMLDIFDVAIAKLEDK